MRLDQITHQLNIKYQDQCIQSKYSTPGLLPEWEYKVDFLLENLDEFLEISLMQKKEEEEHSHEAYKIMV
jgi:hypothetical protein